MLQRVVCPLAHLIPP